MRKKAQKLIEPVAIELRHRFGEALYTEREEMTLEGAVVELLKGAGTYGDYSGILYGRRPLRQDRRCGREPQRC